MWSIKINWAPLEKTQGELIDEKCHYEHTYPALVKIRYCPLLQSWERRPKPRGQTCPWGPFAPACPHSPPLKTCFLLSLCTKGRTTSLSVTSHPNHRAISRIWVQDECLNMKFPFLWTQKDQIWLSDLPIWFPGFVTLLSCWLWDVFSACFTNTNCGVSMPVTCACVSKHVASVSRAVNCVPQGCVRAQRHREVDSKEREMLAPHLQDWDKNTTTVHTQSVCHVLETNYIKIVGCFYPHPFNDH